MKRSLFIALFAVTAILLNAQTALKKVYNEDINPIEQIDQALAKAKAENKNVICQVGGNWCPWCLRFADFISRDTTIWIDWLDDCSNSSAFVSGHILARP